MVSFEIIRVERENLLISNFCGHIKSKMRMNIEFFPPNFISIQNKQEQPSQIKLITVYYHCRIHTLSSLPNEYDDSKKKKTPRPKQELSLSLISRVSIKSLLFFFISFLDLFIGREIRNRLV